MSWRRILIMVGLLALIAIPTWADEANSVSWFETLESFWVELVDFVTGDPGVEEPDTELTFTGTSGGGPEGGSNQCEPNGDPNAAPCVEPSG